MNYAYPYTNSPQKVILASTACKFYAGDLNAWQQHKASPAARLRERPYHCTKNGEGVVTKMLARLQSSETSV